MRLKIVKDNFIHGRLPEPGELFACKHGGAVYIALGNIEDLTGLRYQQQVLGVSLESGNLRSLDNQTLRREGFLIYQPVDGVLQLERVRDK